MSFDSIRSMWMTRLTRTLVVLAATTLICEPAFLFAQPKQDQATKTPTRVSKTQTAADGYSPVEMFLAMDSGDIKVELIPRDATQANIFVTNISDRALAVEMPEAFVGVPILAQGFGNGAGRGNRGNNGGGNNGGGNGSGGSQGLGGGSGQGNGGGNFGNNGGGNNGGGNNGGGIFNIPPGKRAKVQVSTVCLEFHKADPKPSMKYEIRPASELIKDPSVIEMIKMVANDQVTQQVAQAATWHRTDGLSWEFLRDHNRKELSNGYFERFFTSNELDWAKKMIPVVDQRTVEAEADAGADSHDSRSWRTERRRQGDQ